MGDPSLGVGVKEVDVGFPLPMENTLRIVNCTFLYIALFFEGSRPGMVAFFWYLGKVRKRSNDFVLIILALSQCLFVLTQQYKLSPPFTHRGRRTRVRANPTIVGPLVVR